MAAAEKKESSSMSFAKDIGEKIQQSMTVATSTGDKFFGAGGGNPNLVQNSSLIWVALIAVAALVALYLYLRMR